MAAIVEFEIGLFVRVQQTIVKHEIEPDVLTYTLLIKGFCRFGSLIHARQLFAEMLLRGLVPNTVTLIALIYGHCKKGEMKVFYIITVFILAVIFEIDVGKQFKSQN